MSFQYRLGLLILSFSALMLIGYGFTGSLSFAVQDLWFTSGVFLVILISLIDQPHFSKEGQVFLNSITAATSLLLFDVADRSVFWFSMSFLVAYLLISSYLIMWVRRSELAEEPYAVRLLSRINRHLGRPDVLFSIFFFWGVIEKLSMNSPFANALFIFWSLFIVLNIPSVARLFDELLQRKKPEDVMQGSLISITNPLGAFVSVNPSAKIQIGSQATFHDRTNTKIAVGTVIDDRIVAGERITKTKITELFVHEATFSDETRFPIKAIFSDTIAHSDSLISIVDIGTSIGKLVFFVNPNLKIESGELIWVPFEGNEKAYYQIVAEEIIEEKIEEKNELQFIKVTAGQLGKWTDTHSRFEQIKLVATAGELIFKISPDHAAHPIPSGSLKIGEIPNSKFPIHINIGDFVTHNGAILGVTGSGKSYLAFNIIDGLVSQGVKVLILDPSRQHFSYLQHHAPVALRASSEVVAWFNSDSKVGIHQFADKKSYPLVASEFVENIFNEIVSKTKLRPGTNEKAKLCIIFEEAHSLIPEWNQTSEKGDSDYVNKTAKVILQGRKFGLGSVVITQRTANITKTILNQCNTIVALQSFDQTGLDFLRNYMGDEYANTISVMPPRHAILVGKASSSTRPVMFQVDHYEPAVQAEPKRIAGPAEMKESQSDEDKTVQH